MYFLNHWHSLSSSSQKQLKCFGCIFHRMRGWEKKMLLFCLNLSWGALETWNVLNGKQIKNTRHQGLRVNIEQPPLGCYKQSHTEKTETYPIKRTIIFGLDGQEILLFPFRAGENGFRHSKWSVCTSSKASNHPEVQALLFGGLYLLLFLLHHLLLSMETTSEGINRKLWEPQQMYKFQTLLLHW